MSTSAREIISNCFERKESNKVPIWGQVMNIPYIEKITHKKLFGASLDELQKIIAEAYNKSDIDVIPGITIPQWGVFKEKDYEVKREGYQYWKLGGDKAHAYEEAIEHVKQEINLELSKDDIHEYAANVNRLQKLLGEKTLIVPHIYGIRLEALYHTVGIENFSIMTYEDSSLIEEYLERQMINSLAQVEIICANSNSPIIQCCDDLGMKNTTLFSPNWLRTHYFPKLKKVSDKVKSKNRFFSYHSCGNVTEIIPDIIEAGVDALNPLEHTAGMNLEEIKEKYGNKLVLAGNIDVNLIQEGSTEDVRKEIRRCLDIAAKGGGYFLKEGITQTTPLENVIAYYDEAKTYQGWKKQ